MMSALDLVGALADDHERRVAVEALDSQVGELAAPRPAMRMAPAATSWAASEA